MPSRPAQIASAVATSISGGSFTSSFSTTYSQVPILQRDQITTPVVYVTPVAVTIDRSTRGAGVIRQVRIDVTVLAAWTVSDTAAGDTYMEISDEIQTHLLGAGAMSGASLVSIEQDDIVQADAGNDLGQFQATTTFTYEEYA